MFDFSIVVPSYGRPNNLVELLASLSNLSYPKSHFEVIVVDDGSPIPLSATFPRQQNDLNLTLLEQHNLGPGAARNNGASAAQGRFLIFTDDDCQPQPLWLQTMANALGKTSLLICGGRTINGLSGNIFSEASQLLTDHLAEHYSPESTYGGFFPSNNLAISKEGFRSAGGFDASLRFGEDRDFCYRCASKGFSFSYVPEAVVYHYHPQTMPSFFRLHACYGGGTYAFRHSCAKKGLPKVRINPPSWYLKLILAGTRKAKSTEGVSLSLLLLASQAAVLYGMLRGALTRR